MLLEDGDGDGFDSPEDCDDSDALVHPGATEMPYDGEDQDCDGADVTDVDGDGFDAEVAGGEDCDDGRVGVSPDALEACGNVRDDDCDALIDEGCEGDAFDPQGIWWSCASAGELGWVWLFALFLVRRRR